MTEQERITSKLTEERVREIVREEMDERLNGIARRLLEIQMGEEEAHRLLGEGPIIEGR